MVGPVLEGSLDRSLDLAASMESRGYGRTPIRSASARRLASALTLTGLVGVVAGLYGVLDGSVTGLLGMPLLLLGVVVTTAALLVGARRDVRSRYRLDPRRAPEWAVTVVAAVPAHGQCRGQADRRQAARTACGATRLHPGPHRSSAQHFAASAGG